MTKKDPLRALAIQATGAATVNIEDRISRWLEILLQGAKQPEGPISIAIVHVAVDQSQRLLRSLTVEAASLDAKDMAELVDTIALEVAADAEDLGGMQRYQLKASIKGRDIGSTTIRYAMDTMPAAIDSEPASHRGLVAQSQRHTEAAFRMLLQANGSILASFQQRLAAQEEMLARYQAQSLETLKLQEELLVQKTRLETRANQEKDEHEMRMMEAIEKHERSQVMWQTGMQRLNEVFPILLQCLCGNKGKGDEGLAGHAGGEAEPASSAAKPAADPNGGANDNASNGGSQDEQESATDEAVLPLNAAERVKAAVLLREHLLPVIIERYNHKQPLLQPGDDPSSILLARRLLMSCSPEEVSLILASLPEPARSALKALANSFGGSSKPAPGAVGTPP